MSTELARRTDVIASLDDVQRVAKLLAVSSYFDAKGDNPAAIAQLATKILAGREMGFEPFASVQGIHIIQGKPTVSAQLMAAAVKRSGKYDYRVRRMDGDACEVEFFQRTDGGKWDSLGKSTFTLADAKSAGTQNLAKYARNMMFARAMSNGVKWYCPDVFTSGVYTPEEMGAAVDGEGEIIEVQAAKPLPEHAAEPPVWADWRNGKDAIAWAENWLGDDMSADELGAWYEELKAKHKPSKSAAMFELWAAAVLKEHDTLVDGSPAPEAPALVQPSNLSAFH